jgi:hypothetical protein
MPWPKYLGATKGRQAGQTVGSFGPNRPFAATLAGKAAFAGRAVPGSATETAQPWFFNGLQERPPARKANFVPESSNYNLQKL